MVRSSLRPAGLAAAVSLLAVLAFAPAARAHCDTTRGPVIADARRALEGADVTPVLKWVHPPAEAEVRAAFDHALRVRALGPEARELADTFFFETLVRVHRAGEGAPYTGLKDEAPEPVILAVDEALASGKVDGVVEELTAAAATGVRERYAHALEARRHADESVERGREYVAAYVDLTHYVERLHLTATSAAGHGESPAGDAGHEHQDRHP
jgi:hypothetical protein